MVEKPLKPWGSSTFSEISKRKKVVFSPFLDIWPFLDPFLEPSIWQTAPWNASISTKKGSKRGPKYDHFLDPFFDPFGHSYAESTEKVVILGPHFGPLWLINGSKNDHFLDPFLDPFLVETNAFQGAIWHIGGPKRGPKMGQNMTSFFDPFCHPYAESSEKVVILDPLFWPFCHYGKRG